MNWLILILVIIVILIWAFWDDDKAPNCGCFPDSDPYPINNYWIPYTGYTGVTGYTGPIRYIGSNRDSYPPFRAARLIEDQMREHYVNSLTYDIPVWEDYRYHGHTGYSGNINRNKKEARPSWAKYLKAK